MICLAQRMIAFIFNFNFIECFVLLCLVILREVETRNLCNGLDLLIKVQKMYLRFYIVVGYLIGLLVEVLK